MKKKPTRGPSKIKEIDLDKNPPTPSSFDQKGPVHHHWHFKDNWGRAWRLDVKMSERRQHHYAQEALETALRSYGLKKPPEMVPKDCGTTGSMWSSSGLHRHSALRCVTNHLEAFISEEKAGYNDRKPKFCTKGS